MAQDDYYYEIQLTNKQLVFYFLAGATVLILCFLAGIMVGRGVDVRSADTRVAREEPVAPVIEDRAARATPTPTETYTYARTLVDRRVNDSLEARGAAAGTPALPAATPTPRNTPRPEATPRATPTPRPTPTPKPRATPKPHATPTPRTASASRTPGEGPITLQVGAFKDKASADSVTAQLRRKGFTTHVISPDGARDGLYIVRVGPYKTRVDAERARTRLEQDRFKPFIVRQ